MEITKELFDETKSGQKSGKSSKQVSDESGMSLKDLNDIYACESWPAYVQKYGTKEQRANMITPAQAGYYKSLIAKKAEENIGLKEQRGWLLEQVYFLRKAVRFLENRKMELEKGVMMLEKNIEVGVEIMEQLEGNKDFQQLSEGIAKKNQ